MASPLTITEFDRLLDEARAEGLRRHSGEHHAVNPRPKGLEPTLTLGNYGLTDADPAVRKRRRVALPASMALHALAAAAIAIVPLLLAESLPDAGGVRAFFVEPIAAPPPPPPPPPRSASSRRSRCRPRSSRRRASTSAGSRGGWPAESRAAFPAAWWAVSSEDCRTRLLRPQ